jgi:general secretion pathway protein C
MWLKITQLFKARLKEIGTMNTRQMMDSDFIQSSLILLAITILSFEATDLFYKIIRIPLTKQAVATTDGRTSFTALNNQRRQPQDYTIITERNIFLTTLKEAKGSASEGGIFDSEQKAADFDLRGTVACNSSYGFIFIEERGNKKQKLYRLGDMIGSSKLVKITRNTATLRSGGRDITVKVKETVEGQLLPDSAAGSAASRNLTLSKQAVNEKLGNLSTLMNRAVIRPFIRRGVQEGFIISNIAPGSLYEKMGLQNGDIVVDVNNNKIKGADDLLQVVNLMQSGSSIGLNIKRRGKEETINYKFE